MNYFNADQVAALAPDPSSLKSGRELANALKWESYACNERVLFGEIKGSGKEPYRTQIDLQQLGFKCSCPSRKFPCKHGLGLLFLRAQQGDAFPQSGAEPSWVSEWMDKRSERAAGKTEASESVAAEEAASAKRSKEKEKRDSKRQSSVEAGAAELELWLRDMLRIGLLALPEKEPAYFEKTAARMVDAKATGLGNWVLGFTKLPYTHPRQWQGQALSQAARLYLLIQGFKNLDKQSPLVQEDIRALVGWNLKKEDLLQRTDLETVEDQWLVLARVVSQEPNDITLYKFWLYGQKSRRFALLLDFAYRNMPIQTLLAPGTSVDATLVYYPSNWPLRALVKTQGETSPEMPVLQPEYPNWVSVQPYIAQVISRMPWATEIPIMVGALRLIPQEERWFLYDEENAAMEVKGASSDELWDILAQTGGRAVSFFLLRSDHSVKPLAWQF